MAEAARDHGVFGEVLRTHPGQILLQQSMHTVGVERVGRLVQCSLRLRRGIMRSHARKHFVIRENAVPAVLARHPPDMAPT